MPLGRSSLRLSGHRWEAQSREEAQVDYRRGRYHRQREGRVELDPMVVVSAAIASWLIQAVTVLLETADDDQSNVVTANQ
jgi:hypothetical protein